MRELKINMEKEFALPKKVLNLIDSYFQLSVGGKKIRCPYYLNRGKQTKRFEKRVFVGKGRAEEIISTIENLAKNSNKNLENLSAEKIRDFIKESGIGIDCSGFVSWILDTWYQEKFNGQHLWRKLQLSLSFLNYLRYLLRPIENLDVKTLISSKNSRLILKPTDIEPGDLIHLGKHHLLIVYQVSEDLKGKTKTIFYCHSSDFYEGVHKGEIEVKNSDVGLEKQSWLENGKIKNWSFQQYLRSKESGIVRLEFKKNEVN